MFFFRFLQQGSWEKRFSYYNQRRIHQQSITLRIHRAFKPTSRSIMNDPKRLYKTPGQMLAIHEKDAKIYPYLSSSNQSDFKPDRPDRQQMCHFVYVYQEGLRSNYHQRPENLPFTRNDLQAFLDEGLKQFERGYWSVYWASDARLIGRDTIYPDGYRSVVSFRTIEFMIRPMPDYRDRSGDGLEEPKRL